mmetsp:Transcript_99740/g.281576  ORF Transcript_99740/g.281576 Transcript_99740/m.281576 type:complete len:494 (+) Transcript_99740:1-1482(+)
MTEERDNAKSKLREAEAELHNAIVVARDLEARSAALTKERDNAMSLAASTREALQTAEAQAYAASSDAEVAAADLAESRQQLEAVQQEVLALQLRLVEAADENETLAHCVATERRRSLDAEGLQETLRRAVQRGEEAAGRAEHFQTRFEQLESRARALEVERDEALQGLEEQWVETEALYERLSAFAQPQDRRETATQTLLKEPPSRADYLQARLDQQGHRMLEAEGERDRLAEDLARQRAETTALQERLEALPLPKGTREAASQTQLKDNAQQTPPAQQDFRSDAPSLAESAPAERAPQCEGRRRRSDTHATMACQRIVNPLRGRTPLASRGARDTQSTARGTTPPPRTSQSSCAVTPPRKRMEASAVVGIATSKSTQACRFCCKEKDNLEHMLLRCSLHAPWRSDLAASCDALVGGGWSAAADDRERYHMLMKDTRVQQPLNNFVQKAVRDRDSAVLTGGIPGADEGVASTPRQRPRIAASASSPALPYPT